VWKAFCCWGFLKPYRLGFYGEEMRSSTDLSTSPFTLRHILGGWQDGYAGFNLEYS